MCHNAKLRELISPAVLTALSSCFLDVIMNVVRASAVAVRFLSASALWVGLQTRPLWCWVVWSVTLTAAVTSTALASRHQGSATNARVNTSTVLFSVFLYHGVYIYAPSITINLFSPDWTTGLHCEHCRPGSFGSALAGGGGCVPCECNGHGDPLEGFCHNQTGQCYCTHHTHGVHCEFCLPGYYGDPRWDTTLIIVS